MAAIAGESFSNVRVVKAFAEEDGSVKRFKHYNDRVYSLGLKKGYIWGANMFFFSTLRQTALTGVMFITAFVFEEEQLSVGEIMAYLLYLQSFYRDFSEMSNQF